MKGRLAIAAITAVTLTLASGAAATADRTLPTRQVTAVAKQQISTVTQIYEATRATWTCQDKLVKLGVLKTRTALRDPATIRGEAHRKWVLKQRIHRQASCLKTLHYVADHLIPDMQDWLGAVQWVQRIYPGTEQWMRYISDREGGWGGWVWYGGRSWSGSHVGNDFLGADTVGGWMQFRYSTFAPYWRQAQEDLRRRGYILPNLKMPAPGGDSQYVGWLSPMGQALTAGYMRYTGKDGCHWCLG